MPASQPVFQHRIGFRLALVASTNARHDGRLLMCTAYQFSPLRFRSLFSPSKNGAEESLTLVRPTNPAPVHLPGEGIVAMRWGFARPWSKAIVNSRDDKLAGPVWRAAFAEKRCLIPMTAYFEWSGPTGQKRTYRFTPATDELLWAAGIWEDSSEWGRCYSMITCSPNSLVATVHDRMPAVLLPDQQEAFLAGKLHTFAPPREILLLQADAPNPLRKSSSLSPPVQGELF